MEKQNNSSVISKHKKSQEFVTAIQSKATIFSQVLALVYYHSLFTKRKKTVSSKESTLKLDLG